MSTKTPLAELMERLSGPDAMADPENAARVHDLLAKLAAAQEAQAEREKQHAERERRRLAGLKARPRGRKLTDEQRAKERAAVERLTALYGHDREALAEFSGLPKWRVREYLREISSR